MLPTAAQADQAALVQVEMLELFAKLEKEGVDLPVTLAGTSSAIAALVASQISPTAVPRWFAAQARAAATIA